MLSIISLSERCEMPTVSITTNGSFSACIMLPSASCNKRLLDLEPSGKHFLRGGNGWFPHLSATLKTIGDDPYAAPLTSAERALFTLLKRLQSDRNSFMHRLAPTEADVSTAAMCMVGLLKYAERLTGEHASDLVWQSPPIEGDVVSAIRYTRLEEYSEFIAVFVEEKYPRWQIAECPSCNVVAVVDSRCEACFEEIEYLVCPITDQNVYFMSWQRSRGDKQIDCPHCGESHNI
jgi:hypothetical protein